VLRHARSGLAHLSRLGSCIDAGGAAIGTSIYPIAPGDQAALGRENQPRANRQPELGGVLGAVNVRSDVRLERLRSGHNATSSWLLAFLTILLALLAATALAMRRRSVAAVFPARGPNATSDKPLLFLDVDGVIDLKLLPASLPGGKWHHLGLVQAHLAEHAAEHVRALATRYDIVWATGWEQGGSRRFRPLRGLEHDLHVLQFGLDAASGSSHWKVEEIDRAGGKRAVAWLADRIEARDRKWARRRSAPTLLVQNDPDRGITDYEVARLIEWADTLRPSRTGRFARHRSIQRVAAHR
jgi:hypothetical protein